jgi:TolB-like protein
MPFINGSGDSQVEYLSDGLTDSLIFRFSQLPNLKVSPTSSVMRFKNTAKDVAEVARELDVDAVLSGRLMKAGDDLSISVQLIDARTRKLIWPSSTIARWLTCLPPNARSRPRLRKKCSFGWKE